MNFSLVSTVFNESDRLALTIQDIESQTLKPTEIIITDACSTDGTFEALKRWKETSKLRIILLQKEKCNVAEGRNLAIKSSNSEIIASMDFGCRLHPKWLESIIEPFNDPNIMVVGGNFTVNEEEQESLPSKAAYVITNGYQFDVYNENFIASSRSIAYRKKVYEEVGGYCEWLTLAADDLVFGMEIKSHGYKIYPVNEKYVQWGRHITQKGYEKEAYRYGLGDGEANVNIRNFASKLIGTFMRSLAIIIFPIIFIFHLCNTIALLIFSIISYYTFKNYLRFLKRWIKFKSDKYGIKVLLYGFYFIELTNINYVKGYIKGLIYSNKFVKEESAKLRYRLSAKKYTIS